MNYLNELDHISQLREMFDNASEKGKKEIKETIEKHLLMTLMCFKTFVEHGLCTEEEVKRLLEHIGIDTSNFPLQVTVQLKEQQ